MKKMFMIALSMLTIHSSTWTAPWMTSKPKTDIEKIKIAIIQSIDRDNFGELKMIAEENPQFDWQATLTGFVDSTRLPNMTPLAYAIWKKSTNCTRFIKTMLQDQSMQALPEERIQLAIMQSIDRDNFGELKIIAEKNPQFDWQTTLTGFVDSVKLPNMTPLAYAAWKKSTNCTRFIKTQLLPRYAMLQKNSFAVNNPDKFDDEAGFNM